MKKLILTIIFLFIFTSLSFAKNPYLECLKLNIMEASNVCPEVFASIRNKDISLIGYLLGRTCLKQERCMTPEEICLKVEALNIYLRGLSK